MFYTIYRKPHFNTWEERWSSIVLYQWKFVLKMISFPLLALLSFWLSWLKFPCALFLIIIMFVGETEHIMQGITTTSLRFPSLRLLNDSNKHIYKAGSNVRQMANNTLPFFFKPIWAGSIHDPNDWVQSLNTRCYLGRHVVDYMFISWKSWDHVDSKYAIFFRIHLNVCLKVIIVLLPNKPVLNAFRKKSQIYVVYSYRIS